MDKWFNSKWFVRAVSLAFAILLYVFVNIEVTTTQKGADSRIPSESDKAQTLNDIPVDIRIDSERFVVSGVPEFVTVSLEGTSSVLTRTVMQRNFDLYVDLQELDEGTYTVDIKHAKIPNELSVYIEPKTIDVVIEERASKEFTVTVDFINKDQLPEGYELGETEINPNKVTLTSSRSVIDQIAIVKAYIDVAGLTESVENREVPVNVYDAQGNGLNVRIEPESVIVSVELDNPSKIVPVQVSTTGELPEGYSLTSISSELEEVEVFSTTDTLDGIDELVTEDIDLSEVTESGTFDVKLNLPEGVTVANESLEVIIDIEQTKIIEDVPIEIKNEKGQDVQFQDPTQSTMRVTVVGNDKEVSEITGDNLQLSIDIKGLDEGEHKLPVSIEGPENVMTSAEFKEVTIKIT